MKESQLFIILKPKSKKISLVAPKWENFTGSGGLIWIEVSVILYTQKQEGSKTSSQSKGSITAADHRLRVLKKLRSGPLKAAAHCQTATYPVLQQKKKSASTFMISPPQ